jgi:hypothetical protein
MLGRKNYTQEELDHAKTAIDQQLAAYKQLVKAIDNATSDPKVTSAREAFEPLLQQHDPRPLTATSSTDSAWSPARTATHSTRSSFCPSP